MTYLLSFPGGKPTSGGSASWCRGLFDRPGPVPRRPAARVSRQEVRTPAALRLGLFSRARAILIYTIDMSGLRCPSSRSRTSDECFKGSCGSYLPRSLFLVPGGFHRNSISLSGSRRMINFIMFRAPIEGHYLVLMFLFR